MNINKKVGNIRLSDHHVDILYTDGTSLVLTEKGKIVNILTVMDELNKLLGKTISRVDINQYFKYYITYDIYADGQFTFSFDFMLGGQDEQNSISSRKHDSWLTRIRRFFSRSLSRT